MYEYMRWRAQVELLFHLPCILGTRNFISKAGLEGVTLFPENFQKFNFVLIF